MAEARGRDADIVRLIPAQGGNLVLHHYKLEDAVTLTPNTIKAIADYWAATQEAANAAPEEVTPVAESETPRKKPTRKPRAKK
ncbi:MAG: hypothetical protein HRF49_07305 [bacterium]|jgi:hypothetical protein